MRKEIRISSAAFPDLAVSERWAQINKAMDDAGIPASIGFGGLHATEGDVEAAQCDLGSYIRVVWKSSGEEECESPAEICGYCSGHFPCVVEHEKNCAIRHDHIKAVDRHPIQSFHG